MARRSGLGSWSYDLFDSHAHLTDSQFSEDIGAVLKRARSAGVREILVVSQSLPDSRQVAALASRYDGLYCAVGIHPHEADNFRSSDIGALKDLCIEPCVKAVGEIGLDFFRNISSRPNQEAAFRGQVSLARIMGLPMVIHVRDAGTAVRQILEEEGYATGVLHCYSGDRKMLEWALSKGMYISLAGNLTYNDQRLAEAVKMIPSDRLLVETDSPYLAPVPERGRRNEPAFLFRVVETLAGITGENPADIARRTRENARRCFGIV